MMDTDIIKQYLASIEIARELGLDLSTNEGSEFVLKSFDGVERFRACIFVHVDAFLKGAVYGVSSKS